MPTYENECRRCGDNFYQWQSIHDQALTRCLKCGGPLVRVISDVKTYGVGARGQATVSADAMDARIDMERPAYKRLRDAGMQPPAVMGSSALERHGDDPMYVESGGHVAVPEHRRAEISELMSEAKHSGWNPVTQVHAEKGT